jgi:hypothetical protein
MTAARLLSATPLDEDVHVDSGTLLPPSAKRPSGVRRHTGVANRLDPVEAALLSRPVWDSRRPEPAVHEVLYRFAMGDATGALAAADLSLDGHRVPALTVSLDVLDEIDLDHCAALVLAHIDGMTDLSQVLRRSGLTPADALRTMCELIERHLVVLRSVR